MSASGSEAVAGDASATSSQTPQKPQFIPFTWQEIDGIFYPSYIIPERLEKLKTFPLRPDDIFVCTYPKGGSHWVSFIVQLILNNGVEKKDVPFNHMFPWLEAPGLPESFNLCKMEDIERLPNPRCFFSHAYYSKMPGGPPSDSPARYIYVARNPKDTFVSYYHFHVKVQKHLVFDRTWDQFFDEYIKGRVFFGSWWDHIPEWWSHRDEKNVLFLKYEDLKKDLPKYVETMANFLGYNLGQDIITKIASMCSFNEMKTTTSMGANNPVFMRKGVAGDWKEQLSERESSIIDAHYAEAVEGTGLEFDFGD